MKKTQQFLAKMKLPTEDNHALKTSAKRFKDGGQYRLEILLTREEIREMARIGQEERIEVCLFVGPRATFETGAQTASTAGKVIGLQHRGADQLVYAIEDVRRACDLGIRSILPADLGLIWVLDTMKRKGELPKMNIPTDLSPAQMGAIRQAVDVPIDLYIEVPDNFGGFIRYYEMATIITVAAPVYFKFGLRNAPDIYPSGVHIEDLAVKMGRERVHRARIALDLLAEYAPDAKMSPLGSKDLGIPEAT